MSCSVSSTVLAISSYIALIGVAVARMVTMNKTVEMVANVDAYVDPLVA